jgi:hypothetical protein
MATIRLEIFFLYILFWTIDKKKAQSRVRLIINSCFFNIKYIYIIKVRLTGKSLICTFKYFVLVYTKMYIYN